MMMPGLVPNTPIVKTSFRISQPGQATTARFVLGIPQAYLIQVAEPLRSVGEMTLSSNDTSNFHERLGYIEDVPIPVTVVLGKAEMTVGDLQNLEEGDVIELGPPCGEFTLAKGSGTGRPLVLVSGGVGVTPVLSMLHAALARREGRDVYFIHGAVDGTTHAFGGEVSALSAAHPRLRVHVRYTRPTRDDRAFSRRFA